MAHALLAFAAFAALITIIPGLDTMLVVRTAAVNGAGAGLAAGLGIGLGCLCWAVASGLGITALLTASHAAYEVLRWAGAGYLCYLGIQALRRRPPASVPDVKPGAFRTGLVTNLLNPKIGVFYVSVLPQFIPDGVAPLPASVAMALVHDLEGMLWFALLVLVVGRAAALLARASVRRRLDQVAGLVFIGFGVRLAIEGARNLDT
jgi:threonine/homoserine/homoserine lactone efflux protein